MIERAEFAAGMTAIGIAVRQAPDPANLAVYHDVLGPRLEPGEWQTFVRWALEGGRWTWFPKLRELQDAIREFRGDRPMLVEANEAYERVLAAGLYCPEGGTTWEFRQIKATCGEAAAEAFLAAGGNAAFGTTWEESKRRERFVSAYGEAVRDDPDAKLLPAGPTFALPPAHVEPTREEAAAVVEKLRDLAGVEAAPPKVDRVVVTDERLAELKRQAESLTEPVENRSPVGG